METSDFLNIIKARETPNSCVHYYTEKLDHTIKIFKIIVTFPSFVNMS